MYAQNDQDSASAVTPSLPGNQCRAAARTRGSGHSRPVARAVGDAQPLMRRWLAGRRPATGMALAAAGWAATFAAVTAGGHLGRGAAVQVAFAATMLTFAMVETLLSSAVTVIIDYRVLPGAGRYKRLGTAALVVGCLFGPSAGGAALGAGWATNLLTSLAVVCAVASIAARRLGRLPVSGASRAR